MQCGWLSAHTLRLWECLPLRLPALRLCQRPRKTLCLLSSTQEGPGGWSVRMGAEVWAGPSLAQVPGNPTPVKSLLHWPLSSLCHRNGRCVRWGVGGHTDTPTASLQGWGQSFHSRKVSVGNQVCVPCSQGAGRGGPSPYPAPAHSTFACLASGGWDPCLAWCAGASELSGLPQGAGGLVLWGCVSGAG